MVTLGEYMTEEQPPSNPEVPGQPPRGPAGQPPESNQLLEVRDALRLMLDQQIHTLDQLLQRSAVLLGAASVLAGLLAASTIESSTPAWRQWTTTFAFVALLASLGTGIVAVWPVRGTPQLPPGTDTDKGIMEPMDYYVRMKPKDFLREQCEVAYGIVKGDKYDRITRLRRRLFQVEAIALVIGGVLVAINGLAAGRHFLPLFMELACLHYGLMAT